MKTWRLAQAGSGSRSGTAQLAGAPVRATFRRPDARLDRAARNHLRRAGLAASAGAPPRASAHGQLLRVRANTNESSNWFGYNLGSLALGGTLFNSITGDWTVPTASSHTKGQDEYSSDWIGIGGGCVDAGCTVGDNTLIQTGTEQDAPAIGGSAYSAWWEIIPGLSIGISMTIKPGDHMHASIAETVPNSNVWVITLHDVTESETFSQTVPYSSSHLTAEWIEETPLLLGTNAGFAALPNLTSPAFDLATVNGQPANLKYVGGDGSHRLPQQRDRYSVGARSGRRRLQRVHVGDLVRGASGS